MHVKMLDEKTKVALLPQFNGGASVRHMEINFLWPKKNYFKVPPAGYRGGTQVKKSVKGIANGSAGKKVGGG